MKGKVAQSCLTLCDPMDYTVHGILQARILQWVAFPFSRDLPNPGIEPRSPAWQADSLPAEPQGKPKNTGVGSRSLLQGLFPTQESNQGLLNCRRILYQQSYQGIPVKFLTYVFKKEKKDVFICSLFFTVLGLHCSAQALTPCGGRGFSFLRRPGSRAQAR